VEIDKEVKFGLIILIGDYEGTGFYAGDVDIVLPAVLYTLCGFDATEWDGTRSQWTVINNISSLCIV